MATNRRIIPVLLVALVLVAAPLALAEDHHSSNRTSSSEDGGNASMADHTDGNHTFLGGNESDAHDHGNASSDHQSQHASEHEHEGDAAEREVHVESHGNQVHWQLQSQGNGTNKQIQLLYLPASGMLKLQLESSGSGNHTEFTYIVHFQRVVEYRDVNNNSVFDPHNDTVVSSYNVRHDMTWTVGQVQPVTVGNRTGQMITAVGTFDGSNGTLTVRFYAFGGFVDLNGTQLRPTDLKFDLIFDGFPWQANDTRLALLLGTHANAETHVQEGESAGNASVNASTTSGGISGYLSWASNATVDGGSSAVAAHVYRASGGNETGAYSTESSLNQELSLNYAHGNHIVHDPVLGVTYATASSASNPVPFPGAALILGGLAAVALVMRRRKP